MTRTRAAAAAPLPTPSPSTAPAVGLASILPGQPAGSLALATALAASARSGAHPAEPDAALIEIGHRWRQAQQDWRDVETIPEGQPGPRGTHDQAGDAIAEREREIRRAASAMPARSLTGLVVKARILATEAGCYAAEAITDAEIMAWAKRSMAMGDALEQAAGSLVADLLRLAGEPQQ